MPRDPGCGGVRAAMEAALPTFPDHRNSCQQPRWASAPAKYSSATHLPPVPVAQRGPTVWESSPHSLLSSPLHALCWDRQRACLYTYCVWGRYRMLHIMGG